MEDSPSGFKINSRKILILDIDETLVHSSFEQDGHADFFVDV